MSEIPFASETADNERALVGGALMGGVPKARELLGLVQPAWFEDASLARAWSALRRVLEHGMAEDAAPAEIISTVAAELGGDAGDAPGTVDLHLLVGEVPSAANATWYARCVRGAYVRRQASGMLSEADLERNRDLPTADLLAGAQERARQLRELLTGTEAAPALRSAADFANEPQPAPVLWRDPEPSEAGQYVDAVLSVGECAILASAGGLGKSTFTLEIATASVAAADFGAEYGASCGLRAVAGPVVTVSYEDAPARIAHRLRWMNGGNVPAAVHLAPDPAPLWVAAGDRGGESRPGPQWDALWSAVREIGAKLVVIDPVSAALADVSTSETGPVRAFLRALTAEAAEAGAGVLLVAHDTKAARDAIARGEDPGAGVVAGSAAWYDGARGVLSLMRDPHGGDDRLLECSKANYGRTGWGARLRERTDDRGAFRGLTLGARMIREDLAVAKSPPPKPSKRDRATAANGTVPAEDIARV